MLSKVLSKLFIVEDDNWFVGDDQKTYSDLLDIALCTDEEELRIASLIRIRSMAFDYIRNNNPIGYMLIADWNALQKQTDNALTNYFIAANAGISKAARIIDDYKTTTESSAGSCILLAEACFLNGNDQEGVHYLKKCMGLGCKGAEDVLQIHSKGSFRLLNSFEEISSYVSDFKWRLSERITLDYGKLDELHQEKTIHFCCGFAIAKGALATVNRDDHTVSISHSYMERVLVKLPDKANSKKVSLLIKERRDMETAIRYLTDGICTVVDFSECRTELARNIFDTLGGLLFGITGEINKLSDNEFEYKPCMKEANGTEPELWSSHE